MRDHVNGMSTLAMPKTPPIRSSASIGMAAIPNHVAAKLSDLDMRMVVSVPEGGNWKNIPHSIPSKRLEQIRASFLRGEGSRSTYYGRLSRSLNAQLTQSTAWIAGSSLGSLATLTSGSPPPPATLALPPPQSPALPAPVLGGTPTPPPSINNGWDAEQHVASTLAAAGWSVHIVSRQQLGYDIFAQRGSQKRYVEVKSSLGLCSPSLTAREWQQANYHAANYVLAIVENFNASSQNVVYWICDPANRCTSTSQTTISHGVSRSAWTTAVVPLSAI